MAAHPRGRGERVPEAGGRPRRAGSSPRARGTEAPRGRHGVGIRLIPAGAGNGPAGRRAGRPRRAHPRGRGERGVTAPKLSATHGSSPRARGTGPRRDRAIGGHRLIPAGAGNGRPGRPGARATAAHPRGRGERWRERKTLTASDGSSPRARGTEPSGLGCGGERRLIPAGAGNGGPTEIALRVTAAHPRGRGERVTPVAFERVATGSSPRARGTVHHDEGSRRGRRLIPAGAGNGTPRRRIDVPRSAHPRGRGERVQTYPRIIHKYGSSPRARGTGDVLPGERVPDRLIPAGAGNGGVDRDEPGPRPAHPRGRGERFVEPQIDNPATGSSPRARGTDQLKAVENL